MEKNESGMRSRDAFNSVCRASARTTGMNTTTTGVLFTKAESGTVKTASTTRARNSLAPASRRKTRAESVDRAGPLQRGAEHEHAADHDRRAVAEDRQRLIRPRMPRKRGATPSALIATRSGESHSRRNATKTSATSAKTMIR